MFFLTGGLIAVGLVLRSFQWRILLSASKPSPLRTVFWATCAGYVGNNFLPVRGGELVRTMMASRLLHLSYAYVISTALCERVTDAIFLSAIGSAILVSAPALAGKLGPSTKIIAVVSFGAAVAIALLPLTQRYWQMLIVRFPVPVRVQRFAEGILRQVVSGMRSLHDRARLTKFLGCTVAIWLLDAVTAVTAARAIRLAVTLEIAILLIAALGIGSALPSTPGYVGIFQFIAVAVLAPFGIRRNDSIAYILLFQVIQYTVTTGFGIAGLWQSSRLLARTAKSDEKNF